MMKCAIVLASAAALLGLLCNGCGGLAGNSSGGTRGDSSGGTRGDSSGGTRGDSSGGNTSAAGGASDRDSTVSGVSLGGATLAVRTGTNGASRSTTSSGGTSGSTRLRSVITHTVSYVGNGGSNSTPSSGGTVGSGGSNPCGSGAMMCESATGATCINVTGDSTNCGRCGRVCPHGASCEAGECRPVACAPTFTLGQVPTSQIADEPSSVAVGDFDGDGNLDVATANGARNTVSVALGRGNATFRTKAEFATGSKPLSVAVADLNGDTRLDLVTANSDADSVSVLLGRGDGTFDAKVDYPTGKGPHSVVTSDLSGDGIADLATANEDADSVSVLLGTGKGAFVETADYAVGYTPVAIAVGDFDGDHLQDLATANEHGKAVTVILGTGDGGFLSPANSVGDLHYPLALAVGDLDGDGDLDLAVADRREKDHPSEIVILRGKGDGTFPLRAEFTISGDSLTSIASGDLNGDGRLDLLAVGEHTVRVALGEAQGTVGEWIRYFTPAFNEPFAPGDFNNDKNLDVLTVSSGNSAILLGRGDGTFTQAPTNGSGDSYDAVVIRDLNADGNQDVVTTDRRTGGTVRVLLGAGNGGFLSDIEYPTGPSPIKLEAGDLNGDGALDLVTGSAYSDIVTTLMNAGDGSFTFQVDYAVGNDLWNYPGAHTLMLGDLDGQGRLAICYIGDKSTIDILLKQTNGTFSSGVQLACDETVSGALADLNGDGLLDLITTEYKSKLVRVRLGLGDGRFAPSQGYATSQPPLYFATGDLNGDGKLDLAVIPHVVVRSSATVDTLSTAVSVMVMLGRGDGSFAPSLDTSVGAGSSDSIELGDINGDGTLDVVLAQNTSLAVLVGAGDGTFGCALRYPLHVSIFALADLNSDQRLDLVSTSEGGVAVYLNAPL